MTIFPLGLRLVLTRCLQGYLSVLETSVLSVLSKQALYCLSGRVHLDSFRLCSGDMVDSFNMLEANLQFGTKQFDVLGDRCMLCSVEKGPRLFIRSGHDRSYCRCSIWEPVDQNRVLTACPALAACSSRGCSQRP
ncbi:hypothetical protein CRG98_040589 [Punica granatum]|uniref:Secreted protein n=1 Tax=Punica granatum TaxID=22663 RepID=A0A2I0I5D1_PUNGR|nr:hypothetical protein CRG98_040589 [Punica granatum]